LQGNPFLAQRIMNQERTEQPVMKKKTSFAFILAMILMFAFAATAIAGAFNETFNAWLYRIWPEAATTLMPVNMSCEDNSIRLEVISAVADGQELYITYSMEDLKGNRLSTDCSPVMYVDSVPDNMWDASFEQSLEVEATGKIIFGEHFTYNRSITSHDSVLKAHVHNFTSCRNTSLVDLFPYLEQYGSQVKTANVPEDARTLWRADVYGGPEASIPASMQVIDPAGSLEIPLAETVYLSGIGMVNGQLHVQLHFVNHRKTVIGEYLGTVSYRPDETDVMLRDKDCEYWYDEKYQDPEKLANGISAIGWGTQPDDPDTPEWAEIIFTADAAGLSADAQELFAEIREVVPVLGSWNVEIPVRLIRHID
jgi:hypothetical protein